MDPNRTPARRIVAFDPETHRAELIPLLDEIARSPELDARALDRLLKRHPRGGRGLFSKSEVIAGFRHFAAEGRWDVDEARWVERLRMRPIRTLSGVTPVTVLTKPYPCPGRCVFCPNDVRMPKSYLSAEPGAQRAQDCEFDPYLQTWNRLDALRAIGHPVEKAELIVLGGTWSFYPERYQIWFATRCFQAMGDFGRGIDGRAAARMQARARGDTDPTAAEDAASYNRAVARALAGRHGGSLLHRSEGASWTELAAAQCENETAATRCVGLSVETRPDCVSEAELLRLRRLGVTKVQIGLQSTSDRVLAANRRGCDTRVSRRALRLLRAAGFKIQGHWMANLLGADPQGDVRDFARLFEDPGFRPDELKVYPCSLVESAELMDFYRRGAWRPYDEDELLGVVVEALRATPPWCRLTRVIRDFSAGDIAAGSRVANLREVAERALREQGGAPRDIRAREIRGDAFEPEEVRLRETAYATSVGTEVFLEAVTPDERLAGFARLSLPDAPSFVPELGEAAVLREVHVYGASLGLGRRATGAAQHAGLGRRLVDAAGARARRDGFARLSVISAVGTRAYYRSLGFADGELYQHRTI